MDESTTFDIRFTGPQVVPATIRAKDLASIISAVEVMLVAAIEQSRTRQPVVTISLIGVSEGSTRLHFGSDYPAVVLPVYTQIATAIAVQDFAGLPRDSVAALHQLQDFARKRRCDIEMRLQNGADELLATLTPSASIAEPATLTSPTTIYGYLIRIGGKRPAARLDVVSGETISVQLKMELARQLAPRLYTWIGLHGVGTWNAKTDALESFVADDIAPYQDTTIVDAMAALARVSSQVYETFEDVNGYIRTLRGDEDEA